MHGVERPFHGRVRVLRLPFSRGLLIKVIQFSEIAFDRVLYVFMKTTHNGNQPSEEYGTTSLSEELPF